MAALPSKSLTSRTSDFQARIDAMINSITHAGLPLQRKAFQCCVDCFPNYDSLVPKEAPKSPALSGKSASESPDEYDAISRCIQECQKPSEQFSSSMQNEMQMLQNNLHACQQVCFNRFAPLLNDGKSTSDRGKIEQDMEQCVSQCFDQYEPFINEISQRMQSLLNKLSSA